MPLTALRRTRRGATSLDAGMTACAATVHGESHGAVMTDTAVFSLGEAFHGEIGILLNLQCFRGKEPGVTQVAAQFLFFYVSFVGEPYRFNGFGVGDVAAMHAVVGSVAGTCERKRRQSGYYEDWDDFFHFFGPRLCEY